ncbi:MAG: TIGR02266 family protein [Myxococcales bacterium]|nr:TIGR02266 family protein [Myxococcales bacterium]
MSPRPELERSVAEFRNLNRRRLFGTPPLDVAELERWGELRESLGAAFEGKRATSAEQREHLRLPSHLKVVFENGDELREAFLENISEGGLFIRTQRPLCKGAPLRLRIVADALPPLEVSGRVVWSRELERTDAPAGMGVEFEGVDEAARELLDRLIEWVTRRL